ncbi:hypothetical protein AbraIFM66951_010979 [Aspergillus brasiliensis]|uniref:6-methylsalicylate decarboxylase n=1 Tax=Aspergillus brasiliensis TaxID=319629 RepID=A0A9W6DJB3_9EURO|nr:hypothetical protein AbraCBS73388_003840 [Aspergillus brasiliensis]GKZ41698.1 hypothetical protein AbraIFM66951_010979 [Aspergillus brasiliensis]
MAVIIPDALKTDLTWQEESRGVKKQIGGVVPSRPWGGPWSPALYVSNTKRSYPDCKVILSHAGGTLPFLITRICTVSKEAAATARIYGKSSEEIMEDFRSFYFDLALSSSEAVLKLVLDVIPHDHITYGSDFPYASPDKSLGFKQILDGFPLDPELRDKIYFGNANNLFNKP